MSTQATSPQTRGGRRVRSPILTLLGCAVGSFVIGSGVGFATSGKSATGAVGTTSTTPATPITSLEPGTSNTAGNGVIATAPIPDASVPPTDVASGGVPSGGVPSTDGPVAGTTRAAGTEPGFPAGLICKDLVDRGASYADAHRYWESAGRPVRMDADGNGVPCESRFDPEEVNTFFGLDTADTFNGLRRGLLCKELLARRQSFGAAVRYWFWDGRPARMDADGNGIPCETVYPNAEVTAYFR